MTHRYIVWANLPPLPKVFTPEILKKRQELSQKILEESLKDIPDIRTEPSDYNMNVYSVNDIRSLLQERKLKFFELESS